MSKLILIGILSFLFVEGFSQTTIKGKVTDAMSGEMLNQALIKANGNVVTSDKNGNFTLQVPTGEYELVASLDGYNNDTIIIDRLVLLGMAPFVVGSGDGGGVGFVERLISVVSFGGY